MGIFLLLVNSILISHLALAAPEALMLSPGHDERVDVSNRVLRFTWKGEQDIDYILDVFYRKSRKPSRSFRVRGPRYEVRFKKLPPVFYWRARPAQDLAGSSPRVNRVHLYQKSVISLNSFVGYSSSHVILSSKDFRRSANVSGNLFEIHADYRPEFFRNKFSFALNARQSNFQSGGDDVEELRLAAEVGYHLRSGQRDHHSLYLGYYLVNNLDFKFEDVSANYSVNFLTLRHFFRKPMGNDFEAELGTGLQLPVNFLLRPSITVKPLLGYRMGQHWRLDAFAFFENYVSRPEEESAGETVDIRQRNLGAGIGVTYRN